MTDDDMESSSSAVSEPEPISSERSRRNSGKVGGKRTKKELSSESPLNNGLSIASGTVQYQTQNGLLSVLPQSFSGAAGHNIDLSQLTGLTPGTTVIMTQDGQQFLIPVSLSGDQLQVGSGSGKHAGASSSVNSNSSSASTVNSNNPNLTPQQHVMAEEAGRKREVRLLKNREAAKECRRKKKEYIKCLENRVAVLENQNKALIEELKSLKELYCKSTAHD